MHFGKNSKLIPRYIGAFKILKNIGIQVFMLDLHLELSGIHDVFHVCYLKKYYVKEKEIIPLNDLQVEASNQLIEKSEAVIRSQTRKLRNKEIKLVLVKWKHSLRSNQTWKT